MALHKKKAISFVLPVESMSGKFARREDTCTNSMAKQKTVWIGAGVRTGHTRYQENSATQYVIVRKFARSTAPGDMELWARNRFTAVRALVKARRKDLSHIAADMQAFEAQKNTVGGYKSMYSFLWYLCGQEYDQAHPKPNE